MHTFLFYLPFLLFFVLVAVYGERKIAAFIQSRLGPMDVGPKGIFQTLADLLKMMQKEDIVPKAADKSIFLLGPILVFTAIFAGFSMLPLNSNVAGAAVESGVLLLMAVVALDVLGILMAGWGSNNKFSLYGAVRAIAQIVSFEIPLGLSVLCVVMICQSMDLQEITRQQGLNTIDPIFLFGLKGMDIEVTHLGGILSWNVVKSPLLLFGFLIFFIAGLAKANRAPFDLPESESELVGGYHTEYSGFRWGIFMLAEYGIMLLISFLAVILFFGGWNTPFINLGMFQSANWTMGSFWEVFWLLSKTLILVFVQMWVRWTYPRLRVDQLMTLSWKYLTPFGLLLVFLCGLWKLMML
ncbi:MAG: NADH-quinone oxidoreductase subunit H [Flammeovirgaceae bacterium TMED32]|nr:MAG: NADH-quinone oxidoreductase subunit H [Flammeovirgaceae bacterium TMED32]